MSLVKFPQIWSLMIDSSVILEFFRRTHKNGKKVLFSLITPQKFLKKLN